MARDLRSNFQIPENFEFPEVLPRTRRHQRTMSDPNAAAAVVAVTEIWHVDPYHRKFNPSTKPGQAIFEKKTKGLPADEHFTATKKDSRGIRRLLQEKSSSLGAVVTLFPQEYYGAGNVTAHGNLLTEYFSIDMDLLQRESHKRYSNAIAEGDTLPPTTLKVTQLDPANNPDNKELFYSRVDSQVFVELIKNILTDAEYAKLMLKMSLFTFEDDTTGIDLIDDPSLLKLLMDRVDPNIVIGIEVLHAKLESLKLHYFGNNVDAMLKDMEENYVKILDNHSTCESICK